MRFVFSNHNGLAVEWFTVAEKKLAESKKGHRLDWEELLGLPNSKLVTATTLRGFKTALTKAGANWGGREDLVETIAHHGGLKF